MSDHQLSDHQLSVYNRFEMFWYEPEVTSLLDDLLCGETDEFSRLTDMLLAIEGEDWKVAIVPMEGE